MHKFVLYIAFGRKELCLEVLLIKMFLVTIHSSESFGRKELCLEVLLIKMFFVTVRVFWKEGTVS